MRYANGAGCFIDVLAACAAGTKCIDSQILGVQLKFHRFRLGNHGNRNCRCMDTALCFGFGNTLHTVYAAFKLHAAVYIVALDHKRYFLNAAQFRIVFV